MATDGGIGRTRERTRARILEATRRLIDAQGYPALSMAEVAREAGLSRQGLYLHFPSKVALLLALIERLDAGGGIDEVAKRVTDTDDPVEALDRAIEGSMTLTATTYGVVQALEQASYEDAKAAAAWEARLAAQLVLCRLLARGLSRSGRLTAGWTAPSAADVLWSLTSLSTFRDLVVRRGWSRRRAIEHLQRAARAVLVAGG